MARDINNQNNNVPRYPWGFWRNLREQIGLGRKMAAARKERPKGDPRTPPLASVALLESMGTGHTSDELRWPAPPPPPGHEADLKSFNHREQLQATSGKYDPEGRRALEQALAKVQGTPERLKRCAELLATEERMLRQVHHLHEAVLSIERERRRVQDSGVIVAPPPREDGGRDGRFTANLKRWVDGRMALYQVRGYSNEELYSIAHAAHTYYYQGKVDESRSLAQGLYALNPSDPYVAVSLGVVEYRAGNPRGALAAFEVAIRLNGHEPLAWLNRAEVHLAEKQLDEAYEGLHRAKQVCPDDSPLLPRIDAILTALNG